MKLPLTIISIVFVVTACKKNSLDKCLPERTVYEFLINKQIDTFSAQSGLTSRLKYRLIDGNKIVFRYQKTERSCPEIADEEGIRDIVFQMDPVSSGFILSDSLSLKNAKTWSQSECFGCEGGRPVFNGNIQGTQTSANTWHIKATITGSAQPVNFEGDFYKAN